MMGQIWTHRSANWVGQWCIAHGLFLWHFVRLKIWRKKHSGITGLLSKKKQYLLEKNWWHFLVPVVTDSKNQTSAAGIKASLCISADAWPQNLAGRSGVGFSWPRSFWQTDKWGVLEIYTLNEMIFLGYWHKFLLFDTWGVLEINNYPPFVKGFQTDSRWLPWPMASAAGFRATIRVEATASHRGRAVMGGPVPWILMATKMMGKWWENDQSVGKWWKYVRNPSKWVNDLL